MLSQSAVLAAFVFFAASGEMAATPVSSSPSHVSLLPSDALHNTSFLREDDFVFGVPGTPIKLHLSNFHGLLNQGELDLCIIEGLSMIFDTVVAIGSDGRLPLHMWSAGWVNIIINIEDVRPPDFVMTYKHLVSTLRGIAFFASQHGYVEMDVAVYHDTKGHIGIGYIGQLIPPQTSWIPDSKSIA